MPLPALLTIQSGINQLRYATLKGIMAAKKKEIRKVAPASLPAARTSVAGLDVPRKTKQTQMIAGSPAEAGEALIAEAARDEAQGDRMILVVAEQQRGKLHRASWEAVAAAQELAGDQPVEALVLGANPADAAAELSQAAVTAVHVIDSPLLDPYTPDAYTDALQQAIGQLEPTHVVLPHTYRTRDFAPKLAARLDRPLVTDCVGIKRGDRPTFLRPVYQGKLVAEVAAEGDHPHFVSVQIGAYRADMRSADRQPLR